MSGITYTPGSVHPDDFYNRDELDVADTYTQGPDTLQDTYNSPQPDTRGSCPDPAQRQGPTPEVWLTPEAAPMLVETPTPEEALSMLGTIPGAPMTGGAIPGVTLTVLETTPEEAHIPAETTEYSRTLRTAT
ncbi:hypothetical protein N0V84_012375 [Fusarium piperis]|uniref:Uncharacterized protein n=1 Tax=Fusarium piperis TaxID=1435070 RepID=A0A9W8TBQ7_9HYPO|nr:hypothetical protein N0V84_012375 [Fusarium piperis]